MQDFTHLILLIGTNPLPNYVVARYFLEKNKNLKNITAIHTKGTQHIAERLKLVLDRTAKHSFKYHYCLLADEANARQIWDDILRQAPITKKDRFHLNYTGGTKNMAVHAYKTLFTERTDEKFTNCSFSYLDAKTFKIILDQGYALTPNDLRGEIAIDLENLLALHHCYKLRADEEINWPAAHLLFKTIIEEGAIDGYLAWKNEIVRPLFYNFRGHLTRPEKTIRLEGLKQHEFWPRISRLLTQIFPEEQRWKFDDEGILILESKSHFAKNFAKGIEYLDGRWFESYALSELRQALGPEEEKFQLYSNWHIKKEGAHREFELDLVALYGYQLCGMSVTTSHDRKLCKSKAFEILHRARQIGGDEARSILLTPNAAEETADIESDLLTDTGRETNVKVFGLEQLRDGALWKNIKAHMLGE